MRRSPRSKNAVSDTLNDHQQQPPRLCHDMHGSSDSDDDLFEPMPAYRTRSRQKSSPASASSSSAALKSNHKSLKRAVLSDIDEASSSAGGESEVSLAVEDDDQDTSSSSSSSDAASEKQASEASDDDLEFPAQNTSTTRRRRPGAARSGQKRSVALKRDVEADLIKWHPELDINWDDLQQETDKRRDNQEIAIQQPEALQNVTLLPYQLEGLHWFIEQEKTKFAGGILADEMGMGKTLQMIALLVAAPTKMSTLVICPVVAMIQWREEIEKYTGRDTLSVTIYHGAGKVASEELLLESDIVLTSYAVVESAYRKQKTGFRRKNGQVFEDSLLHSITWGRVILDEAHCIKDRSCSTARAVFALKSDIKWSLSGTPLQNRVGELYSLIRFLGVSPFSSYFCKKCPCKTSTWKFSNYKNCDDCGHGPMSHFCWWNKIIMKPIQKFGAQGEGRESFTRLGILLDQMMIRRTKIEKADDLGLPPRIVTVRRDYFNEEEEDFYQALYSQTRTQFARYVQQGTVLNNYSHIFALLSKLRLAADHPFLVVHQQATRETPGEYVCGLCHEICEDAISSKCKHVFCRADITQYMESFGVDDSPAGKGKRRAAECPVCFVKLAINLEQDELSKPEFDAEAKEASVGSNSIVNRMLQSERKRFNGDTEEDALGVKRRWSSSTKIEALMEELTKLRQEDHTIKSLVFSQFVSFLDLIHWRLRSAGFNCVKLDGRMTPEQRQAVIRTFMTVPQVTVFLVSLKAGGVALNLTEASRVFIMDPWWNPAVENQAMDRIHRLGQHRPVKVIRMILENSIESRIEQLQEKKKILFESTVGKDVSALERLAEEDLAFLFQM